MSELIPSLQLDLQVRRSEDVSRGERSKILELLSRSYSEDFKPILETFTDSTHVLGNHRGELVTHALWVTRWLQCSTLPLLQTAYVEAITTPMT